MDNILTHSLSETEIKILDAAKKIFIEKGFDGASMQDIANEAGINKALLHYYFRKKEFLFQAIFKQALFDFIPNIMISMTSNEPFLVKLKVFIENYIEMLTKHPHIPIFILHELSRRPENLVSIIKSMGVNPQIILSIFEKEIKEAGGEYYPPEHLIINTLAMCIFPFAAKPIISSFIFNQNEEEFQKFISERKQLVYDFIIKALKL
ncbi:MAG TPA: helix-turn-helix domain-containing protein [Bacteroidales bacterium]|jgi:AcrR family transcriptional regulator|nr:TetR/AcrR family transcriptional regulator [Bacteroidales bacterium]HNV95329.1 helix-turn-helix domain-containing protein [Bacteroidales bacterium]